MKTIEQINPNIAHISQTLENGTKVYFQVLNEDETDWDEQATTLAYQEFNEAL